MDTVQNQIAPRILVVGGDEEAARSLASLLRRAGYKRLTLVTEGRRAVLSALREHYDVAIVETCLSGMSGYEVAERLINLPGQAEGVPVILISADGSEAPIIQASILNAAGVVTWPVRAEELGSKVAEALGRATFA